MTEQNRRRRIDIQPESFVFNTPQKVSIKEEAGAEDEVRKSDDVGEEEAGVEEEAVVEEEVHKSDDVGEEEVRKSNVASRPKKVKQHHKKIKKYFLKDNDSKLFNNDFDKILNMTSLEPVNIQKEIREFDDKYKDKIAKMVKKLEPRNKKKKTKGGYKSSDYISSSESSSDSDYVGGAYDSESSVLSFSEDEEEHGEDCEFYDEDEDEDEQCYEDL